MCYSGTCPYEGYPSGECRQWNMQGTKEANCYDGENNDKGGEDDKSE